MKSIKQKLRLMALIPILLGCDGFLDQKPRQSYVVPTKVSDYQALLDNTTQVFNFSQGGLVYASDELKITPNGFNALNIVAREFYSWDPEALLATEFVGDWIIPYQQVFVSNIVLDGLEEMDETERNEVWHQVHAQALFSRAFAMYNLLQLFADPYTSSNATESFGLPYPTSSNINLRPERENLGTSYQKVIDDLKKSVESLPSTITHLTRPSKAAAYLMLSKVYLILTQYEMAEEYAQLSLELKDDLMDFNELNPTLSRPVPAFNEEQIYYAIQNSISQTSNQIYFEQEFIDTYDDRDLRKKVFFQKNQSTGLINFKGSYAGNLRFFGGLAVDETIFVLAESKIRNSKLEEATELINGFLKYRFIDGEIIPVDFSNESDPLHKLFEEKHKQLVFRGVRWTDLRRLMAEGRLTNVLSKNVGNELVQLAPREKKWTYLIPFDEMSRNNIPQNPR